MNEPNAGLKRWRRVKLIAALSVFGLIVASVADTVILMIGNFRIAAGDDAPSPDSLSDRVSASPSICVSLLPFVLISVVVYLFAARRVRQLRKQRSAKSG